MKKKLIYIIGIGTALFVLYCLGCMFSPATMTDKGEVKINSSMGLLYVMINDIKEWPKWLSWTKEDGGLQFNMGGREVGQGANLNFEGASFGKGRIELEEAIKDSLLAATIINEKWPGKVSLTFQFIPESKNSILLMTRSRIIKKIPFLKRLWYRNFQTQYQNIHQKDIENLKAYIEGMISANFGTNATQFSGAHYIGIKSPIYNMNIPKFYAESYPKIYKVLDSLKMQPAGPPVGLIYDWDGTSNHVYIMAALPISEKIPAPSGFEVETVPTIPCIKMEMYGHYNKLKTAHAKLDYLMNSSNFTLAAPIIEEYVTSPSAEPDTSKWLTNIYYLLDNSGAYSEEVKQKKTREDMIREEEEQRKIRLYKENNKIL